MSENHGKSTSEPVTAPSPNADSERSTSSGETFEVPDLEVLAAPGVAWHLQDQDRLTGWLIRLRIMPAKALAENTNAAYKADWAHFSSWCRRQGARIPCPLHPQLLIGLYMPTAPHQTMGPLPCRLARSSGASLASPGITSNAALPSIARIATSPPFWRASGANTRARPFRRKPVLAEDILGDDRHAVLWPARPCGTGPFC